MPTRHDAAQPRTVLLVGASNGMSYARMPQLLAAASLRVAVMAPPGSPAYGSSHVAERFPVPAHAPTVQRRLRGLLTHKAERFARVIVCDEDLLAGIARHLDEPWAARCFPVPVNAAPMIAGKTGFIAACQTAGIPVPVSRICAHADEALAAAHAIGYPLLVKADFGASGTTVWRVDDKAALVAALPRTAGRSFVLQQLWTDAESGVTEMLCSKGRVLAVVSSVMCGIDPVPFGTASSRRYRRNRVAEAVAARIAALTGFEGLCGFDWLQHGGRDGPLAAIEFHPRPTLGFHMTKRAGVDFAAALQALVEGRPPPRAEQADDREVVALYFPKDLMRALRRRDWRGLARWIPGISVTDVPWRDPGLLRALVGRAIAARRRHAAADPAGPSRLQPTLAQSTAFGDEL